MKEKLLVLDDEALILSSLEHLFEDDYEVFATSDAEAALRRALKHDIAVILCDERMPGVSGHEFLGRVREVSKATRLLMSGYADMNALTEAVNSGQIFAYIHKPWEPPTLKARVGAATLQFKLVQEVDRERRLLRTLMAEKDVLIREVHHRVKNNMQIISSLLSMQASSVDHPETIAKLRDSERRLMSMAMIHEQIYGNEEMSSIDFCKYVRDLTENLFASFGCGQITKCNLDLSPTQLTIEQAIPCGLMLNELVTNSLKYAYPIGGAGEITIRLSSNDGHVELTVSDAGVGLPAGFDWMQARSLGLKIIRVLAKQLRGSLEVGAAPGASFTVRFPRTA
jgi:two-component sensor histidine kinase